MSNIKEAIKLVKKVKSDLWDYTSPNVNVKNEKLSEDIELLDQALAILTEPEPTARAKIKEAIEHLTKNVYFWDNEGSGRIAQIPRDDYDQAIAKLRTKPKCKTCGGSGKIPRKEKQHCELRICTDLSIPSCFRCQFYIHEKPCPDCQAKEQPPAGECKKSRNDLILENMKLQVLLDRSEASREALLNACGELVKFCYPDGKWRGWDNMKGILEIMQPIRRLAEKERKL